MLFQSGPLMTESIRLVTHAWPALIDAAGCSLFAKFGVIHETAGSVPACAAPKKRETSWMLPTCPSSRTVTKFGSGFHMPGVFGPASFV